MTRKQNIRGKTEGPAEDSDGWVREADQIAWEIACTEAIAGNVGLLVEFLREVDQPPEQAVMRTLFADLLQGHVKIPRLGAWTQTKVDSLARFRIRGHMKHWDRFHKSPAARRREIEALAKTYGCSEKTIYDVLARRKNYSGK